MFLHCVPLGTKKIPSGVFSHPNKLLMHRCHSIFFGKMLFHTLFQAEEVEIMTGVALRLQVQDEYYDSVECGHAKEEPYKVLF